jgi:hypothetical protein
MSFEARCPQCLFISGQLGKRTPCLLHLSVAFDAPGEPTKKVDVEYDQPYAFGQLRPTVDRPGPFTLRQYVRLQLLRSRIQAERSIPDAPARSAIAGSLASR